LDWVELVPENYIERGGSVRRALVEIQERLPVVFHSTVISIGSTDPIDWVLLAKIKNLAQGMKARWITDHISYSSVSGFQLLELLPLPFNERAIRHVVERIKQVQDFFDIPFGLENPSYYTVMPGSEMTEAEFIREVVGRSQCGLLLDVNNIYVNCFNHSETPLQTAIEYLDTLPLDRVMEVHVAGHREMSLAGKKKLLDNHGASVSAPVQWILRELHQRKKVQSLLLEREQNVPALDELLEEVSNLWTIRETPLEQRHDSNGEVCRW
jgi:uncharacterized protein (UPF0276 family)